MDHTRQILAQAIASSVAVLLLALSLAVPAVASLADEQRQGEGLVKALDAGKRDYESLSKRDFERIGEFWMGRMTGSPQTHEAMNARMRQMMGAQGEERMHERMGRRYARLTTRSSGDSTPDSYGGCTYGPGMMTGGDYDGCAYDRGWTADGEYDYGPMMGMMMGNWRQMRRDDWEGMLDQFDRSATAPTGGDRGGGWDTRDVILLGLTVLLAIMLAASLAAHRPWRRHVQA